ncbi:MAG: hypothetical protein K2Q10_11460, partial [Rhodospirillales bacterium]|nr:hypothetical protein [Rhodospirillales bacterium]
MGRNKHIRPPEAKKGARITAQEPEDSNKQAIIFSFERIQQGNYCFSSLDKEDMARVADALFRRKAMTWDGARNTDRHGLGSEKIPKA